MAKEGKFRRWMRENRRRAKDKFHVSSWILLLLAAGLLFLDATLLRLDHLKMVELRSAVLEADVAEDDEAVAEALKNLRSFTIKNIVINITEKNGGYDITFGTGPFYLEQSYIRAANAALEEAENNLASDENPNGNIYGEAGIYCRAEAIKNGWTWNNTNFINCMLGEINKYPASEDLTTELTAALPSTELYRREYASPIWAPTASGFLILLTLVIIIILIFRLIRWIVLRLLILFI